MSSIKEISVCGYNFPKAHTARKAIIIAIEELLNLPHGIGLKQEDFFMLGIKAGFSRETIRLGGTRRYFVDANPNASPADFEKEKAASAYGIFFTREKVGRAFHWYPIREACELALQHKHEIMQAAGDAAKKTNDDKLKYIHTAFSHASTFKEGDIIRPRSQHLKSYATRLYTLNDLHKSVAYQYAPQSSICYDEQKLQSNNLSMLTGRTSTAVCSCPELNYLLHCLTDKLSIINIKKSIEPYVNSIEFNNDYKHPHLKMIINYHEVMILGTPNIGYINPIEFRVVKNID